MKTIASIALVSLLIISGMALASQSGEQKDASSTMEGMMKGGEEGEHMQGMMRMMKMMDQCASMMDSMHTNTEKPEKPDQGRQK
jgi:hypothetical protein